MMRSGNPALAQIDKAEAEFESGEVMTVNGTINKTVILLGCCLLTAFYAWSQFTSGANVMPLAIGGAIAGLVFALITVFKPNVAHITAPIYALCEGLFIGAISAVIQAQFPETPIVLQAAGLTFGTLFAMLVAYRTGVIKCTDKFRAGVVAATGAIFLVYLVTFILSMVGVSVPYIHSGGPIGIGISLVVIVIAALNLVLDFDFIDRGSSEGAPKKMEWVGAFGLMVTLVWLYIEILRLLAKLNEE